MRETSQSLDLLWRLHLFDGPILVDAAGGINRRFRSQRVGALLAFLGLNLGRPCPREELSVALWPDEEAGVTANRLRVCLASLRRQLEPAGVTFGAVIDVSEHGRVRLRPETVWCDAAEFNALWKAGNRVEAARLTQNKSLLPGYYDEWVLDARNRFDLLVEDVELPPAAPQNTRVDSQLNTQQEKAQSVSPPTAHRLPLYLTPFFGRDTEIQSLRNMLVTHRLVTLTGPGGIGKTRIAVEAARCIQGQDEILFVPLVDVVEDDQVPAAILRALGISAQSDADLTKQLVGVLVHHKLGLVILDNAEQIAAGVANLCIRMLDADPELRVLVTSRQHLEIAGEAILPLSTLENPPHSSSSERLSEWPSIALFLSRARDIRPDFSFSGRSAEAVMEICQRLEGIPLAIELAAARTASETPAQINAALNTNLIDLKSRHRGLTERHRSLRAAIQGSFDMLSPELEGFFAALSVFQGGWTADAAMAVTGSERAHELLLELVTRSLIVANSSRPEDGVMRFSFLEPLRQFAGEELTSEERLTCWDRHAAYYLSVAAQITQDDVRPYVLLDGEQRNMLAALEYRANNRDIDFWNGLFGFVYHAWSRAEHRITIRWVEEAVEMMPQIEDAAVRNGIFNMATHIWPDIGRLEEALQLSDDIIQDKEHSDDPLLRASACVTKSYVLNHMGAYRESMVVAIEALKTARIIGDERLLLWALSMAVTATTDEGIHIGPAERQGRTLLIDAERLCLELISRMPTFSRHRSTTFFMQAIILDNIGRPEEAYETLKRAEYLAIDDKKLSTVMYAFLMESEMVERSNQAEDAAILLGAVFSLQERMGLKFGGLTKSVHELNNRLEMRLGAERHASLLRLGKQSSFEELSNRRLRRDQISRVGHNVSV